MPELPEVEVTRQGVAPYLEGRRVHDVILRRAGLRWPFPPQLPEWLTGRTISGTGRRGKYLLIHFEHGDLIIHLGMSGNLRILSPDITPEKHDHFDLVMESPNGLQTMRMTDPRRFGAVLWRHHYEGELEQHPLLKKLGIEPLGPLFSGKYLHQHSRTRQMAIKQVLLAGDIVVGVGNIYASESLYQAGIHPETPAADISLKRYEKLAQAIRTILAQAIVAGGSTLRDFVGADGKSGYFQQSWLVYDRAGQPCRNCGAEIRQIKQGQRSTFYCPHCQK
jgi:formamidopyrimidine-DNA glycosylase